MEALHSILKTLPATIPPIVITQHMPPGFTASFARRLDNACAPHVQEAMHQQLIKPGNVYIANGSQHLRVGGRQGNWRCLFDDGPANLGHKPSVDVLFNSVAEHAGDSAVGVILTGMGKDGAAGLLNMKKAGAATIGQAERSCVVYGMPRAAKELGGVDKELTLNDIASGIIRLCERIKAA